MATRYPNGLDPKLEEGLRKIGLEPIPPMGEPVSEFDEPTWPERRFNYIAVLSLVVLWGAIAAAFVLFGNEMTPIDITPVMEELSALGNRRL